MHIQCNVFMITLFDLISDHSTSGSINWWVLSSYRTHGYNSCNCSRKIVWLTNLDVLSTRQINIIDIICDYKIRMHLEVNITDL